MNVLLLVFTMLSLLSIMTYTRLQTFLDTSGVRIEYEGFMSNAERQDIDDLEVQKFKTTIKPTNVTQGKRPEVSPEDEQDKEYALSLLNVRGLLTAAAAKGADVQKLMLTYADTIKILQRLMDVLYGKQTFYKEALLEYPELPDLLVQQILQSIPDAPCSLKFTSKNDLAKIPLLDENLREVYVKMLNGQAPSYQGNTKSKRKMTSPGYDSLLKYLTVKPESTIRVYLARKALLQAIFRDPQPIIDRRKELDSEIANQQVTPANATTEFNDRFRDISNTDINLGLLNFTVTKSHPPSD